MGDNGRVALPFAQNEERVRCIMALALQPIDKLRRKLRINNEAHHSAAKAILLFAVRAA
jgi:hypothetical protein